MRTNETSRRSGGGGGGLSKTAGTTMASREDSPWCYG